MDRKSTSESLAQAMERARRHWQRQGKGEGQVVSAAAPAKIAFTIAISREAGAGGVQVARAVGERLGWQVYDREILQKIAEEMGLRADLLESVDERHSSWLRECMEAFASVPSVSAEAYVRNLIETLLSLAAHGECVIVGRGAAHVLPEATTLRIRLVANQADRLAASSQQLGLGQAEAAAWMERTDRERTMFVNNYFQRDVKDPHEYDLILNTSRFSVPECVDLIQAALSRLQVRAQGK